MRKEYTFKLSDVKCECGNEWLFLDVLKTPYDGLIYVCRCARCGTKLYYPSKAIITTLIEHLREVRRNEDNI